jgi:hypothetical protein
LDSAGISAKTLLEHLQLVNDRLREVRNHLSRLGLVVSRPFQTISGSPFTVVEGELRRVFRGCLAMGLIVTGGDAKDYELSVSIYWTEAEWVVTAGLDVEADDGGQQSLSDSPEQSFIELKPCLDHVVQLAAQLVRFADRIPRHA